MLHNSQDDERPEKSLRRLWKHNSNKFSDIPPPLSPQQFQSYKLEMRMRFSTMWIAKPVKIKWRGRMDSKVVATAKLGKPYCLSRVTWKPVRCLQLLVIFEEVHPRCTDNVIRQCGWSKTCSVPLFTTEDGAGMLCKSQTSYHAFSGNKSTIALNICVSRTWYLCFFSLKICKPHQWRLFT